MTFQELMSWVMGGAPKAPQTAELPPTPAPPPPAPQPSNPAQIPLKVSNWATAIAAEEGANPASNNPGNLKWSTLTASWGGTKWKQAQDGGWLCQFPTYNQGFFALCNFLKLACEGELIISNPQPCTLEAFTKRYAGNPPQGYIDGVATRLGVSLQMPISSFLT